MKRFLSLFAVFFVLLILLTLSCGKDKKSPTGPGDNTPDDTVISESAVVIEQRDDITISTVAEDEIVFTFSGNEPEVEIGDVLVSGEGDGYLRKVKTVNVDGNTVTVETEQATLTDIVEKGSFDTTFVLDFAAEKSAYKLAEGVSKTAKGYDFNGFVIAAESDLNVKITNGSIDFTPSLDIDGDIDGSRLQEFHAIATGDLSFEFDIEIEASEKTTLKVEKSIFETLGKKKPRKVIVQLIGAPPFVIPVVEVITFDLRAGVEASVSGEGGLVTGLEQQTHIKVGAEYKSGEWSSVWEKSAELNAHETIFDGSVGIEAIAYVRPVITVKFYAIAGPYIDVEPYIGFTGETGGEYLWSYEVFGGIASHVGFDISILDDNDDGSKGKFFYEVELAKWEKSLLSKHEEYPETPGGNDPHDIQGITFITIPSGTFRMGDIQGGGYSDERPVHDVTLDSFEMSIYEVTQGQYKSVIGSNPSGFKLGDDYPIEHVSWYDAVIFCNALSDAAGLDRCYNESTWACDFSADGFRLPTEAEWEYACRARTETKYYTGDSESDLAQVGWYESNSDGKTHPVGQKEPNAWGIYDMHGNVWEWCNDWYDSGYYSTSPSINPTGVQYGSYRVIRGGIWSFIAGGCRSAIRCFGLPGFSYGFMGFRVVRR